MQKHYYFFEEQLYFKNRKKEQNKDTKNLMKTTKVNPKMKTTKRKLKENAKHEGLNFPLFIFNFSLKNAESN